MRCRESLQFGVIPWTAATRLRPPYRGEVRAAHGLLRCVHARITVEGWRHREIPSTRRPSRLCSECYDGDVPAATALLSGADFGLSGAASERVASAALGSFPGSGSMADRSTSTATAFRNSSTATTTRY